MIRVENLIKQFGDVRAVDGLSFELFPGEILGFLGPNGAGKTTTMRILTCYFPPTAGTANVAGFDVVDEPDEVRRVIGYMPEGVPLYREMSVTDFLDFVAHAKGYSRRARAGYVKSAIEETNLGEVRNRLVGQLSKGFRQRVGLAQAIIGDPKVLILDEPTSGLDPRQIADMRALIKNMAGNRTVILSTHILPEVQMTCSRVIIINRGKIAASGTPEKLTTRVQNRFQVAASIIGPEADVQKALRALPGVHEVKLLDGAGRTGGEVRGLDGHPREYMIISGIEAADVRPAIAQTITSNSWSLLELRQVGVSLEEVFLRVVAGESSTTETGAIRSLAGIAPTSAPAAKESTTEAPAKASTAENETTSSTTDKEETK